MNGRLPPTFSDIKFKTLSGVSEEGSTEGDKIKRKNNFKKILKKQLRAGRIISPPRPTEFSWST